MLEMRTISNRLQGIKSSILSDETIEKPKLSPEEISKIPPELFEERPKKGFFPKGRIAFFYPFSSVDFIHDKGLYHVFLPELFLYIVGICLITVGIILLETNLTVFDYFSKNESYSAYWVTLIAIMTTFYGLYTVLFLMIFSDMFRRLCEKTILIQKGEEPFVFCGGYGNWKKAINFFWRFSLLTIIEGIIVGIVFGIGGVMIVIFLIVFELVGFLIYFIMIFAFILFLPYYFAYVSFKIVFLEQGIFRKLFRFFQDHMDYVFAYGLGCMIFQFIPIVNFFYPFVTTVGAARLFTHMVYSTKTKSEKREREEEMKKLSTLQKSTVNKFAEKTNAIVDLEKENITEE